jgi:hypothetical protein
MAGIVSRHGRRLLDGKVRRDSSSTAMDGAMAPQRQGTVRRLLDDEGRRDGSSTARDGAGPSAAAMDREHNGNGWQWTARWRMDGDGRRDGNSTARNGAMVT